MAMHVRSKPSKGRSRASVRLGLPRSTVSARVAELERRGVRVYTHRYTKGYPTDVDTIVSDEGYGANEYIVTKKPLVVVTAPGPGSGKLATELDRLDPRWLRQPERLRDFLLNEAPPPWFS